MLKTKPFIIPKSLVMEAFKLVKANRGAGGVDEVTLEIFEENLKDNLYKIWNRLSSGSYFPPAIKGVEIPKKDGGVRLLGIPTIGDRVAQMVIRLMFEPLVEPHFHEDSYGYRPKKSAIDAIGVTRKRCWKYDWVLEFDIKGLFDNIDHGLLMKAVRKHTECKFTIIYIERWLRAEMLMPNGSINKRTRGTPQGGVISPILANLFLHYVFDKWLELNYPGIKWCRYADDGLLHCNTLGQAKFFMEILRKRFNECGLEMHPDKTKIAYCKDSNRRVDHPIIKFDFLGYTFSPRRAKNKYGKLFTRFLPGVSKKALKLMNAKTRMKGFRNKTELSLEDISKMYNSTLRGWLNYYGKYYPTALNPLWRHFNRTLIAWAMKKYKKLKGKGKAIEMFDRIVKQYPRLFVHWQKGMIGAFA
jgi:RNA-directed DNA polymerase